MSDVSGAGGGNRQINLGDVVRSLEGVDGSKRVKLSRDGMRLQPVGFLGKAWSCTRPAGTRVTENFSARIALKNAFVAQNEEAGRGRLPGNFENNDEMQDHDLTVREVRDACAQHRANQDLPGPGTPEQSVHGLDSLDSAAENWWNNDPRPGGAGGPQVQNDADGAVRALLKSEESDISAGLPGPSSEQAEGAGPAGTDPYEQEWLKAIAEGAELLSGGPDESVAATARSEQRTPRQLFGETLLDGNPTVETPPGSPDESVAGTISDPRNEPGALLGDKVLDPSFVPLAEPRPEIVDQDAETVIDSEKPNSEPVSEAESRDGDDEELLPPNQRPGVTETRPPEGRPATQGVERGAVGDESSNQHDGDEPLRVRQTERVRQKKETQSQRNGDEPLRVRQTERVRQKKETQSQRIRSLGDIIKAGERKGIESPLLETVIANAFPNVAKGEVELSHALRDEIFDRAQKLGSFRIAQLKLIPADGNPSLSNALLGLHFPDYDKGAVDFNKAARDMFKNQLPAQQKALGQLKDMLDKGTAITFGVLSRRSDAAAVFQAFTNREGAGRLCAVFQAAMHVEGVTDGKAFAKAFNAMRDTYGNDDPVMLGLSADNENRWFSDKVIDRRYLVNEILADNAGRMNELLASFNHFVRSL